MSREYFYKKAAHEWEQAVMLAGRLPLTGRQSMESSTILYTDDHLRELTAECDRLRSELSSLKSVDKEAESLKKEAESLTKDHILKAIYKATKETPARLPPGWEKFAREIETTFCELNGIKLQQNPEWCSGCNPDNCMGCHIPQPERLGSITRDEIREIFMSEGFTIKEGQTDLKDYVYRAAAKLIDRATLKTVWSVSNRTSEFVFRDKESAEKFVGQFSACVAGGMVINEVPLLEFIRLNQQKVLDNALK